MVHALKNAYAMCAFGFKRVYTHMMHALSFGSKACMMHALRLRRGACMMCAFELGGMVHVMCAFELRGDMCMLYVFVIRGDARIMYAFSLWRCARMIRALNLKRGTCLKQRLAWEGACVSCMRRCSAEAIAFDRCVPPEDTHT